MNVLGKSAIKKGVNFQEAVPFRLNECFRQICNKKKGVNFQEAVPFRLFTRSTTRLFQQNHYCPIHDVCSRLLFAGNPTHDLYTGWPILLASPQRAGSLRLLQTRLGLRSGIGRTSNCADNRKPESGEFYVRMWGYGDVRERVT